MTTEDSEPSDPLGVGQADAAIEMVIEQP